MSDEIQDMTVDALRAFEKETYVIEVVERDMFWCDRPYTTLRRRGGETIESLVSDAVEQGTYLEVYDEPLVEVSEEGDVNRAAELLVENWPDDEFDVELAYSLLPDWAQEDVAKDDLRGAIESSNG